MNRIIQTIRYLFTGKTDEIIVYETEIHSFITIQAHLDKYIKSEEIRIDRSKKNFQKFISNLNHNYRYTGKDFSPVIKGDRFRFGTVDSL